LFFFPKKRSILFTHGIEVWNTLPWYKRKILQQINTIVSVSDFTAQALINLQNVNPPNIKILPNTISLEFMQSNSSSYLKERYHIHEEDFILLTICRIDHSEKYKGYDSIIQLMPKLTENHSNIKYVLCGKTDTEEKKRLDELIHQSGCSNHIILTGFIPDGELSELYSICNLFIMPSQKEGFGIVFLEALAHGKPVIGGNKDGTVDALMNGELGILVDPDSLVEIYQAILSVVERKVDGHLLDENYLKQKVFSNFGIEKFNERLKNIIFQN
jgi:glycosyltransferase involved in cell wall biosynthesis